MGLGGGMIKTWNERCEEHPDHQTGMVSHSMIQMRMQEEIDELRAALAQPEPVISTEIKANKTRPLTQPEILALFDLHNVYGSKWVEFVRGIEKAHGIGDKT